MARPAIGATAPTPSPDVVAYAERLRPLVEEALRVRAAWLLALDEFDRRAALDALVDEALHAAEVLDQIALALEGTAVPGACRRAHDALLDWLDALQGSCGLLADHAGPWDGEVTRARQRLAGVAKAAERFNQESRRVPEVLRRVPLLQRAAPVRPVTVVGIAALFALALVLVPPVVQSSPGPTPTTAPAPTFGRGVIKLTATPAPTRTPTIVKRMYTERYLRNSLRLAELAQDAVRDLDVTVEEPNRVVVTGTLVDPPVKLRVPLLVGVSPEGKIRLGAGTIEALDGGRVPGKVTAGLPKRLEELNAKVAEHLPGGLIRNVWVQGDRVVFEVEET